MHCSCAKPLSTQPHSLPACLAPNQGTALYAPDGRVSNVSTWTDVAGKSIAVQRGRCACQRTGLGGYVPGLRALHRIGKDPHPFTHAATLLFRWPSWGRSSFMWTPLKVGVLAGGIQCLPVPASWMPVPLTR